VSVLLTGATGFLGMETLARLLERGERVEAIVRAGDQAEANARLAATLELVGAGPSAAGLVSAVPGELTRPGLGLSRRDEERLRSEVNLVVHCAASVSWDLTLPQARDINVIGTRRVLELAEEISVRGHLDRLVHVSTAYVAGRHRGSFAETDLMVGQRFRNTYEQAKAEGELVVRRFAERLPIAVVRPSIVVGESDSGWTPAFNVIYWPLRAFARGLLREVPALPESRVDIVPVDYVADAIVHALYAGVATPGVLQATAGDDALTADLLIGLTCAAMGRERPRLVEVGSELARGSDQAALYAQYFDMEVVFDDQRSRAQLEPAGIEVPPLEAYFGRLIEFAESARWGKRTITRDEARRAMAQPAAA
jgi:thioester reductase-like protein